MEMWLSSDWDTKLYWTGYNDEIVRLKDQNMGVFTRGGNNAKESN